MNEDINNELINNNEEIKKEIKPQQESVSTSEIDKQKLLLKIQKAQIALANTNSDLEKSKRSIDTLSENERRKLEKRLEELQILVHFGSAKVLTREKEGERINPEERNLEALKEAVEYKAGKVREQRWTEDQYITPKLQQMDEFIEKSRDTINEIDSHIRK